MATVDGNTLDGNTLDGDNYRVATELVYVETIGVVGIVILV